jgi:hypothetical protein
LLQEIVKFSGGKVIKYNQACNKPGTLTRIPSAKNLKQYTVHMCKKESFLEEMINVISECTNEPKKKAVECLCHAHCQKYEDAFASVEEKQGITVCKKKMECAKVEAMLNEEGVNWTNARILF